MLDVEVREDKAGDFRKEPTCLKRIDKFGPLPP